MLLFVTVIILILPIIYLWWYQNHSHIGKHLKNVPGPGYPLLGVALDYFFGDQEQIFKNDRYRCGKYGKYFKFWILNESTVCLQDPNDIEAILSSTKHIGKSRVYRILDIWLNTGLLTSTGDKWKIRRRILTPAFHFTILQNVVNIFNEMGKQLVETLSQSETDLDVVPPISEFALKSIAETAMGIDLNSNDDRVRNYKKNLAEIIEKMILRLTKVWLYDETVYRLSSYGRKTAQIVKKLHKFTHEIINERKKKFDFKRNYSDGKKLAMLDLLIKAQKEEGIIDNEGIREEVDTFMFEGHDTTTVAICYILLLLANHEKIQEEIFQEINEVIGDRDPKYNDLQNLCSTERCIKEGLRLFPSVALIGRAIEEDLLLPNGNLIPKGTNAHIFIYDLHRDPELYPNPLKFDPDRFLPENTVNRHPFAYIPFSAGSRNCIGQKFAILEIKSLLCNVLRNFKLEAIDSIENLEFLSDLVLRSKNSIRIRFVKRKMSFSQ